MPDRKHEEFDLQIRSMLSDAGMKPSRRVWKEVSRRLDAEAVHAPEANSWAPAKWACACLAAAAAIAAGIFIFDPIPTYHNIQGETVAQVAEIQKPEPIVSKEQPVGQETAVDAVPAPKAVEFPSKAEVTADQIETEAAIAAEQKPVEESSAEVKPQETTKTPKNDVVTTFEDPFARMALEDKKASTRPTQFFVGGSLGANDSDFTSAARVSRLSSSVAMAKSGITELGDSSFGIPFSIGLGVRFYLAPRFSLGTGVDYSLLTRSFEGRYNNVNGGIIEQTASGTFFHAMHYIGIPVNAYYDFVSGGKVKFYGYAGGAAEYCVANKYHLYSEKFTYSEPVKGIQWSLGAGIGVEFKVAEFLGIYIDPGARYYFENQHPRNVRTEHPFLINLNAGLRFDF